MGGWRELQLCDGFNCLPENRLCAICIYVLDVPCWQVTKGFEKCDIVRFDVTFQVADMPAPYRLRVASCKESLTNVKGSEDRNKIDGWQASIRGWNATRNIITIGLLNHCASGSVCLPPAFNYIQTCEFCHVIFCRVNKERSLFFRFRHVECGTRQHIFVKCCNWGLFWQEKGSS